MTSCSLNTMNLTFLSWGSVPTVSSPPRLLHPGLLGLILPVKMQESNCQNTFHQDSLHALSFTNLKKTILIRKINEMSKTSIFNSIPFIILILKRRFFINNGLTVRKIKGKFSPVFLKNRDPQGIF